MVVDHDDAGRRLGNGMSKYLARVHQRAVQEPAGDHDLPEDLALAVEREEMKLLDGKVAQAGGEKPDDVLWLPDTGERRPLFPRHPRGKLERGEETSRFGRTDARHLTELGGRAGGEPTEGPLAELEKPNRETLDGHPVATGAEQHGEELGRGQRCRPQQPQAFPGTLVVDMRGGSTHRCRVGSPA
jgi:hypothetical protein